MPVVWTKDSVGRDLVGVVVLDQSVLTDNMTGCLAEGGGGRQLGLERAAGE
jgi:hypothetical protein